MNINKFKREHLKTITSDISVFVMLVDKSEYRTIMGIKNSFESLAYTYRDYFIL